jgi:hypothetical protein
MTKSGVVDIDIYKSTKLKEGVLQNEIKQIFNSYHSLVEKTFEKFDGQIWHRMGDGAICIFPKPSTAVEACMQLLENLVGLNKQFENQLSGSPIFVRIGIHEIELTEITNVPEDQRGKFAHPELDIAGKLQKNCPIGKIALSMEVYKKLELKKRLFRPMLTEFSGKRNFILIDRLIMPQEEKLLYGLCEEYKIAIPPIPFPSWDKILPNEKINLKTLDEFFKEPLLLILGDTSSERKDPIASAATSDAVGIIEAMAAIKSHTGVRVGIDQWEDTADIVSERNIIIIGSGMVNIYAFVLNDIFYPIHFLKTGGRVVNQIVATSNAGILHFGPHAISPKDSGLIVISKSPFNSEKSILWVAGITGMGTQAVASFLKDLILDTRSILSKIGIPNSTYPIACVIGAKTRGSESDWKISDYYKRWRILDYDVVWLVDLNGDRIL